MKTKIAVIGALTTIGRAVLDGLSEKGFAASDIQALDNRRADGIQIPFQSGFLRVENLTSFDFSRVRVVFLCTPSLLSEYKDEALNAGAYVIDCVGIAGPAPCIIPSLNKKEIQNHRLILNPTSLTVTLAHVFTPIQRYFDIRSASATVLLSAGEFGGPAVQSLVDQTRSLYTREQPPDGPFKKIQAFNLIPEVYPVLTRQTTSQIKALLHFPITISTCLTPIFQGECYSLIFSTREKCSLSQLTSVFNHHPICRLLSDTDPIEDITTQDTACTNYIYLTHLGCIPYQPHTYHLWVLCDSFRTGAVANAVRIAEYLLT